jgi:hypothetical protein
MHAPPGRDQLSNEKAACHRGDGDGRYEPFFGVVTRATTVIQE